MRLNGVSSKGLKRGQFKKDLGLKGVSSNGLKGPVQVKLGFKGPSSFKGGLVHLVQKKVGICNKVVQFVLVLKLVLNSKRFQRFIHCMIARLRLSRLEIGY